MPKRIDNPSDRHHQVNISLPRSLYDEAKGLDEKFSQLVQRLLRKEIDQQQQRSLTFLDLYK